MTDDAETNDRRIGKYSPSRRTFLAASLGSPVLFGAAVGSYEAARTPVSETDDGASCTVCPLDDQEHLEDDRTGISIDPRMLSELGVDAGDQVRIARSETEVAVYTVAPSRYCPCTSSPFATVAAAIPIWPATSVPSVGV